MPSHSAKLIVVLMCLAAALAWSLKLAMDQRAALSNLRAGEKQLQSELARLNATEAELARSRSENQDLVRRLPSAIELAELRARAGELAKLQAEYDRVRAELDRAKAGLAARAEAVQGNPAAPDPQQPSKTFTTETAVNIGFGQTAIMGNWALPGGKRGFAFVTPDLNPEGQIVIEGKIVTMPGDTGQSDSLSGNSQTGALLTVVSDSALRSILEQNSGVDVLSAPRVVTTSGTEAEITALNARNEGVTLRFNPRLRPDGRSIDLNAKVQVTMPK